MHMQQQTLADNFSLICDQPKLINWLWERHANKKEERRPFWWYFNHQTDTVRLINVNAPVRPKFRQHKSRHTPKSNASNLLLPWSMIKFILKCRKPLSSWLDKTTIKVKEWKKVRERLHDMIAKVRLSIGERGRWTLLCRLLRWDC